MAVLSLAVTAPDFLLLEIAKNKVNLFVEGLNNGGLVEKKMQKDYEVAKYHRIGKLTYCRKINSQFLRPHGRSENFIIFNLSLI